MNQRAVISWCVLAGRMRREERGLAGRGEKRRGDQGKEGGYIMTQRKEGEGEEGARLKKKGGMREK